MSEETCHRNLQLALRSGRARSRPDDICNTGQKEAGTRSIYMDCTWMPAPVLPNNLQTFRMAPLVCILRKQCDAEATRKKHLQNSLGKAAVSPKSSELPDSARHVDACADTWILNLRDLIETSAGVPSLVDTPPTATGHRSGRGTSCQLDRAPLTGTETLRSGRNRPCGCPRARHRCDAGRPGQPRRAGGTPRGRC